MFAAFGVGLIVGVLLVILALKMTMRLEPTGCILLFAILLFLFFWGSAVALWSLLTG